MPTMQGTLSVAANSVSANVLAGQLYEFLPADAQIVLSVNGAAAGLNTTFLVAGQALVNDQNINTQNRFPIIPDDILTQEQGPAGARLILTIRNTTGGAVVAFWRVDVGF